MKPKVILLAVCVLLAAGCERGLLPSVKGVTGPKWVAAGQVATCSTSALAPDHQDVSVRFAWGDGDTSEWIPDIWRVTTATHAWADTGHFTVKAQARDESGRLSEWLGGLLLVSLDSSIVRWVTSIGPVGKTCPAVGPEGNIYVMTDGYLVALDPTGSELWRRYGLGGSQSPVVGEDGSIYVLNPRLHVLDPAGTERGADTLVHADYLDAPALGPDGAIYAARRDTLVCLNPDGSLRWEHGAPGYAGGSPAIGTDTSVCWVVGGVPSDSPSVLVFRPDGGLKWSARVDGASWVSAGAQGSFIVASEDECYAFDAQGDVTWQYGPFGADVVGPAVVSPGSVLLVPTYGGLLRREPDSTGGLRLSPWRFGMSVLVDAAGHGFAGADTSGSEWYDYAIVLFDSTVEGHRTIPVDDEIPGAPGVSPDGTVYIGTRDGYLYALKGAPGLADTPWPKYGHDSRNTSCAAGH